MSEKILFGELGAGEIATVDVENWDGESKGTDAKFVFGSKVKPLPTIESEEDTRAEEAQKAVENAADSDVPESDDFTPEGNEGGSKENEDSNTSS